MRTTPARPTPPRGHRICGQVQLHLRPLFELKSEKAIKEAGKMRSEGKQYAMQDGDVVNFLFNV